MHQQRDSDGTPQPPPVPYYNPQNFTPPPAPQPGKRKLSSRRGFWLAIGGIIAFVLIAALTNGGKTPPGQTAASTDTATTVASTDPSPVTNASDALAVGAPSTAAAAPIQQQVTYQCTGHAPDGIDITYGADGSNNSASSLPFTRTSTLESTALYYVVTAQLQGGGSVSCTTTVTYDDGSGVAQSVNKSASASGGYNIASAQVCTGFDSSYIAC